MKNGHYKVEKKLRRIKEKSELRYIFKKIKKIGRHRKNARAKETDEVY